MTSMFSCVLNMSLLGLANHCILLLFAFYTPPLGEIEQERFYFTYRITQLKKIELNTIIR